MTNDITRLIEVDAVLARLGGNRKLFCRLARFFIDSRATDADLLRMALHDAGAPDAAVKELHKLKALAATVGNQQLADAAARLETRLRNGRTIGDPETAFAQLDRLWSDGNIALQAMIDDMQTEKPTRGTGSASSLRPEMFAELDQLLLHSNMRAIGLYSDMRKCFTADETVAFTPLTAAIERLDFARAREVLVQLGRTS